MKSSKKYIYWSIPILFLTGSLLHFIYALTGYVSVVGSLVPVNESVWEHIKMVVSPIFLFWFTSYFLLKDKNLDMHRWFTGGLIALLVAILSIPLLFYGYTGALGQHLLIVDILILLISICFGQLLAYHILNHFNGIHASLSIGIMISLIILFVFFTFFPPHLPIFFDYTSKIYGIPPVV